MKRSHGRLIAFLLIATVLLGSVFYYEYLQVRNSIHYGGLPDAQVYVRVLDDIQNQIACYVQIFNSSGAMIQTCYSVTNGYVNVINPYSEASLWMDGETFRFIAMKADMSQVGSINVTLAVGTNDITINLQPV